ncbi:MAG: hypothetical protein D6746_15995 [Bacteroidetes bacterium]|nr:MAG: hypothetical protein D6746_15995 [Bacteroidota bacterium]
MILHEVVLRVYRELDDPLDKFILMASHEGLYVQEDIAFMVDMTQAGVSKRLNKIKKLLKEARLKKRL